MDLPRELHAYADAINALRTIARVRWAVFDTMAREVHEQEGIPMEWFEVLVLLAETKENALRMNDLASLALRSKSGMTRLVDRIEAAGLVYRRHSEDDRRVVLACLTPRGQALLDRIKPQVVRIMIDRFAAHLDPGEARAILTALGRVLEGNDAQIEPLAGAPLKATV
jgi:DNA-binding MarR family transcriptional regulator